MTTIRVALDSNVLVYAEGVNGKARALDAARIVADLNENDVVLPVQALGELFTVLTRKAGWPATAARKAVLDWQDAYEVVDTSPAVLLDAMELACTHQFSTWDAVMLAAAAQAGCRILLSEDMHNGFTWRGTTIRNPFAAVG